MAFNFWSRLTKSKAYLSDIPWSTLGSGKKTWLHKLLFYLYKGSNRSSTIVQYCQRTRPTHIGYEFASSFRQQRNNNPKTDCCQRWLPPSSSKHSWSAAITRIPLKSQRGVVNNLFVDATLLAAVIFSCDESELLHVSDVECEKCVPTINLTMQLDC